MSKIRGIKLSIFLDLLSKRGGWGPPLSYGPVNYCMLITERLGQERQVITLLHMCHLCIHIGNDPVDESIAIELIIKEREFKETNHFCPSASSDLASVCVWLIAGNSRWLGPKPRGKKDSGVGLKAGCAFLLLELGEVIDKIVIAVGLNVFNSSKL